MKTKFFICRHCGNLVGMINDAGVPMMCCGQRMEALTPNTAEASNEKHLPAIFVEDGAIHINVGSVTHPMEDEHYIEWVYIQTERGGRRIAFKPGEAPEATVSLDDDKPLAVYAYCNLHGLWMTEVK